MKINVSMEVTPEQLTKIAAIMTDADPAHAPVTPAAPPIIPAPQQMPSAAPVLPTAPTLQQMFGAPAQPQPQQTAPVQLPTQTTPRTYTVQELGLAARPLVEMGRQQELMNLLDEFGASSVAELPENSRAAFAAKLRTMGGQI